MILVNGIPVNIEHFPDGTQKININEFSLNYSILWKYEKEEELSTLIYITKHLRDIDCHCTIELFVDYLPNARMDRTHDMREVFTLKYFADVINWLDFDVVHVLDVHSNVGEALINRLSIQSPQIYIELVLKDIYKNKDDVILYFPDAGAAKRYAGMFPNNKYCYGEKNRDWDTGKILGLNIRTNGIDLKDKAVLMIDDIISYGGSLYYSALKLKEFGTSRIYAYASYTENSVLNRDKGTLIKALDDRTVERLYTTDSLFNGTDDHITILQVR